MDLKSQREVENALSKLRLLDDRYEAVRHDPGNNPRTQELTLRSLTKLINQMKEEIARFECGASARPGDG